MVIQFFRCFVFVLVVVVVVVFFLLSTLLKGLKGSNNNECECYELEDRKTKKEEETQQNAS